MDRNLEKTHAWPGVVWILIAFGALLAIGAGAWLLRRAPCTAARECVPRGAAESGAGTQTQATERVSVRRDLTADELLELKRYEQRLREIARSTRELYRELAAARQAEPVDSELVRQKAAAEDLRERYETALRQVAGAPELAAQIVELRAARAAAVATNIAIRARVEALTASDEGVRMAIEAADARVAELDKALGEANLRLEDLKREAWRTDAMLGELRRQVLEAQHLYEGLLVERSPVGKLREREEALRREAQAVSEKVAELRARGIVPGELSTRAQVEALRRAEQAALSKPITPTVGAEGKRKP